MQTNDSKARVIKVAELQPGMWLEVDRIPSPDRSDYAPVYEQVTYIEPAPDAFMVHTRGSQLRLGDAEVIVRDEAPNVKRRS